MDQLTLEAEARDTGRVIMLTVSPDGLWTKIPVNPDIFSGADFGTEYLQVLRDAMDDAREARKEST